MANESNILELERFEANSFMGLDRSKPVVIDFTSRKKNQNIVEFFGDQGIGKTSTIMGILFAMGATFGLDKKKLANTKDKDIDVNLKFTYNDEQYHVIADANRTVLKKLNEQGKWKAEESPVAMLRQIFGPVGLSPFKIREMKGKDQIQEFQDLFANDEGIGKKIAKLEGELEAVFNQRRDVNRDADTLKKALEIEPLFQNYEASQERFKSSKSADKEKKRYEELQDKKSKYDQYKSTHSIAQSQLTDTTNQIVALEAQLEQLRSEHEKLNLSVLKGTKWIEDNKGIVDEFEEAQAEWLNLSKTLTDQEKWKDIIRREKMYNEKTEQSMTLTGEIDKKREDLLKLTKKCLPKVEGLEIKIAAGLDKTDKPEGVYYQGQPIHELSESEYTALWCEIFDAAGVNFIFLENTTSFGSDAVKVFNSLAKEGATIFATRMDRKVKEMGFEFKSKID